jgi:hypothetical protein
MNAAEIIDELRFHAEMTRRLFITYEIDDETWNSLVKQARLVFDGESYFKLSL